LVSLCSRTSLEPAGIFVLSQVLTSDGTAKLEKRFASSGLARRQTDRQTDRHYFGVLQLP